MSASPIETVTPVVESNTHVKFSSKNSKFMVFGFWFSEYLHSNTIITDEIRDTMFRKLCLFSSAEEQNELYDSFVENMSATQKSMKKYIACNKPKTRKTQKKKIEKKPELVETLVTLANTTEVQPVVDTNVDTNVDTLIDSLIEPVPTKEKRKYIRKPKTAAEPVVTEPSVQPSAEPVVTEPSVQPSTEPVVTEPSVQSSTEPVITNEKRKYIRKPKPVEPVAEPKPVDSSSPPMDALPTSEPVVKKEKRKYNKKNDIVISMNDSDKKEEVAPTPVAIEEEQEEEYQSDSEEESIITRELFIDGKMWHLCMANNKVYDPIHMHDPVAIGIYDHAKETIEFYK